MNRTNVAPELKLRAKAALSLILPPLLYVILVLSSILLPIWLAQLNLPIIHHTHQEIERKSYNLSFELFGFFASLTIVAIASFESRKLGGKSPEKLLLVIFPLLLAFSFLSVITEFSFKSPDYTAYEGAARAVINGTSPYITRPPYIYPPLLAQMMALAYRLIDSVVSVDSEGKWNLVFYVYQAIQFYSIILAYLLSATLAQNIGLSRLHSLILVTAIFAVNNPLIRTLEYNQINLWILNSFLLAILLLSKYPVAAGFSLAVGAHLKLYPFILLLPWGITRKKVAIAGAIVGFAMIVLIQTQGGQHWELWQQFFAYFRSVEKPIEFRNNSINSIVDTFVGVFWDTPGTVVVVLRKIVKSTLTFAVIAWLVLRFIQREKTYVKQRRTAQFSQEGSWETVFRMYGHSMDAIAFSLLISPSVWEHHYVLAIPIAIWGIVIQRTDKLLAASIATLLIFAIPTFDIFLFSCHSIVGLLILMYLTSPEMSYTYFKLKSAETPSVFTSSLP